VRFFHKLTKKGIIMSRQAKNQLESAVSFLISFSPLFGTVFFSLNKIENKSVSTMGVGPVRKVDLALYYNPDFVLGLSKRELQAVLKHEALHVLLHHIGRIEKFGYNLKGFNIAADIAINTHIEGLPDGALLPEQFGFERDKSADYYYAKLKKQAEDKGQSFDEFLDQFGTLDDHSGWSDCDKEIISEKIRGIAQRAIEEQNKNGWGSISGNLAQQIISANKHKVNWKKEVRFFINKLVLMGRKSTRTKDNRRTREQFPFLNPGSKRNYTSRLLVAFDTSGSVSDNQLKAFVTELNGMIGHVKVDTIMFDTQIYGKPKPLDKKSSKIDIVGRGGTDFHPPIELADKLKYDGIIVFTDGYAPFPPKPKTRVLWCVTEEDSNVSFPYGKKVIIEVKK
jgi:predicted metal-dependent peptidase